MDTAETAVHPLAAVETSYTRAKNLMKRGLDEERAWQSATNGRGPWWNAGASHMNEAFPRSFFDKLGLVSLLDQLHQLSVILITNRRIRNRTYGGVRGRGA